MIEYKLLWLGTVHGRVQFTSSVINYHRICGLIASRTIVITYTYIPLSLSSVF